MTEIITKSVIDFGFGVFGVVIGIYILYPQT